MPKSCDVFAENVKATKNFFYLYLGVIVTCVPEDIKGACVVRHPGILVEVLSTSSSIYDHDFKLRRYKGIASLNYYMLVSQYEYYIELYTRTEREGIWTYQSFDSPGSTISFELFGLTMPVSKVYEGIVFEETTPDVNLS